MTGLLIAFEGGTPDHRAALMRNVISSINMDRRILTFTDPRLPHPQSEAMCRGGLLNAFTGDCIAYRTAINPISDFLIRAAEVHHAMPLLLRSLRRGEVVFVGCFLHAFHFSTLHPKITGSDSKIRTGRSLVPKNSIF